MLHRQEVTAMLSELFDEQAQREQYDIAVKKQFRAEGKIEGILSTLASLVKGGILTLSEAAKRADMTNEEFGQRTGLTV